ncbi:MAG TPA: protein translocase subunit SecD, partial [Tepidisphaeraceae bacterium]|nr:protein translocase subunit SecD [Tepidisphaeraceae bacterium]
MQTNIGGRVLTIVAVMYLAFSVLFPALPPSIFWVMNRHQEISTKPALNPGLDMVGGSSLLYEVIPAEGSLPRPNLSEQVMALLKDRVDPQGVKNLIWRAQGGNRIEIQMPMTDESKQVKELRANYASATEKLNKLSIRWSQVESAMQIEDPAQRQQRLDVLANGSDKRLALFADLMKAQDRMKAAAVARDAVAEADAQLALNRLAPEVAQLNVDAQRVEAELDRKEPARTEAINQLKNIDPTFVKQTEAIDQVVAAHIEWAKVKDSVGDVAELKQLLRGSGVLSFHILAETADMSQVQEMRQRLDRDGPRYRTGEPLRWIPFDRQDESHGIPEHLRGQHGDKLYALVWMTARDSMVNREGLPKWALEDAHREMDPQSGKPVVSFRFDAVGGIRFAELTGRNKDRMLAAVLDDSIISLANINSTIGQNGQITSKFSNEKIEYLVKTLKAGSLPARLSDEPIVERTIGPQLGEDNLRAGFTACIFGVCVVAVFLISYYYLSGVVAIIAVLLNIVLILAGMSMFGATFTLPGVAGIILTIGMAVDANVLIFERLREEQARGLSLRVALRMAYDRAFSAILDSNVTAAITGLILWLIGTEDVKGFGLTLLLGIVASLFTSLYVTRTIFIFLIEKVKIRKLGSFPMSVPWWGKILNPNINWMGKALWFLAVSGTFIIVGLSIFGSRIKGGTLWDIEFAGGTSVQF